MHYSPENQRSVLSGTLFIAIAAIVIIQLLIMCFTIAAVISEKPTSHAEKASYYGTIIGSVSSIVIVSIMSFSLLNKKCCVETLQQSSYISYEATPTPPVSYDNVVEQ